MDDRILKEAAELLENGGLSTEEYAHRVLQNIGVEQTPGTPVRLRSSFQLRRRSWFGRLGKTPGVLWQDYKILRRYCGRWESARAALKFLPVLLKR